MMSYEFTQKLIVPKLIIYHLDFLNNYNLWMLLYVFIIT
jgi:hypothetical protein